MKKKRRGPGAPKKPPGEARWHWKQVSVRLRPDLVEQMDALDMPGGRAVRIEAGIVLLIENKKRGIKA